MNIDESPPIKCTVDLLIYSPSFENYQNLENSNKVILNNSVLEKVSKEFENIEGPMIFKITNNAEFGFYQKFVGVHDFTALDNKIYLPSRVADELLVNKDSIIDIEYYVPPKGNFMKLKPLSTDFYDITDVKDFLENHIQKNYPVLQKDTYITVEYNNSTFDLEVTDCRPFDVISTIDTDIEVDFEPMTEPPKPTYNTPVNTVENPIPNLDESNYLSKIKERYNKSIVKKEEESESNVTDSTNIDWKPFCGNGHRLGD